MELDRLAIHCLLSKVWTEPRHRREVREGSASKGPERDVFSQLTLRNSLSKLCGYILWIHFTSNVLNRFPRKDGTVCF